MKEWRLGMKSKKITPVLSALLMVSVVMSPGVHAANATAMIDSNIGVEYITHIQDKGWETIWNRNGSLSGSVGESKRLEALKVELTGSLPDEANIQTYVHVQDMGYLGPFEMGNLAGTEGKSLRMESVKLVLNKLPGYRLKYDVHVENKGWLRDQYDSSTWFNGGEWAGTAGESLRLEGIRIEIVPVNEAYEKYQAVLAAAPEGMYTDASWAEYKKVLDANVVTSNNTTEEITNATNNILNAQKSLIKDKSLTAYNAALAAAVEADYTPDTWAVYSKIVSDNVMTKANTQTQIDQATENILAAQKQLQHKVNLTAYQAALAAVREVDYTASSWADYQKTLSTLVMTEDNTQVEVDTAVEKITEAQKKMVRKFDFTAYNALLNAVKEEDYIDSSWTVYQDIVDANKVDETDTQTDIKNAIQKIEEAQSKLIKKADLTYYNSVLNAVQKEDYTTASWNVYQKAVESIVVNPTSKQDVIEAAIAKILEAQLSLVPAGDMRYYEAAKAAVNKEDYTATSWAAYQKVVDANVVYATDGQPAIDAATQKIEDAQKKLVPGADMINYDKALAAVDKDDYTSASWATYQKVVVANYMIAGNGQAAVDAATDKITAAQTKLVKRGSLIPYQDVLANNKYLNIPMKELDYTSASWAAYQKVLDANAMDIDKSQDQIDTAVQNIKKAQIKLAKAGIITSYEEILKTNKNLNRPMLETDYTSASWAVYQKVLDANEMDRDKSQAQIDGAVVKIERAQQKLVLKGDITKYTATLDLVKEIDYTVKSWTAYEKLLSSKGYFVTSDNSQVEIDKAVELVKAAQRNLKIKGDTTQYNLLVDLYHDPNAFKTTPWNTYQGQLTKYARTSENTQTEINDAIAAIKRAQVELIKPENVAAILTEYNAALAKTDEQSAYTPTSWTAYQNAIKPYLGLTKDSDQAKVNAAAQKIVECQSQLVRTNQNELAAFAKTLDMYLRNKKSNGEIAKHATTPTWKAYEAQVEKYAGMYGDFTWQQTVITKDSTPAVIKAATAAIEKAIQDLRPDGIYSNLDYTAYEAAVKAAVPWKDDLEIWDKTVAEVSARYTEDSYDAYVKKCNGYAIVNYIESAPGVYMIQPLINNATTMITYAQDTTGDTGLQLRATTADLKAFSTEFALFKTYQVNKAKYTAESWDYYEKTYTSVSVDTAHPEKVSQKECQDATNKLQTARTALKTV